MPAFVYKDRALTFDLTNADDLLRLQNACAALETAEETIVKRYTQDGDLAEQMRALHDMYGDFFAAVFPKHGRELVGNAPSAAEAIKAFKAFLQFLAECRSEEERMEEELRRCYAPASFSVGKETGDGSGTARA